MSDLHHHHTDDHSPCHRPPVRITACFPDGDCGEVTTTVEVENLTPFSIHGGDHETLIYHIVLARDLRDDPRECVRIWQAIEGLQRRPIQWVEALRAADVNDALGLPDVRTWSANQPRNEVTAKQFKPPRCTPCPAIVFSQTTQTFSIAAVPHCRPQ
jgi:hypothetical protein